MFWWTGWRLKHKDKIVFPKCEYLGPIRIWNSGIMKWRWAETVTDLASEEKTSGKNICEHWENISVRIWIVHSRVDSPCTSTTITSSSGKSGSTHLEKGVKLCEPKFLLKLKHFNQMQMFSPSLFGHHLELLHKQFVENTLVNVTLLILCIEDAHWINLRIFSSSTSMLSSSTSELSISRWRACAAGLWTLLCVVCKMEVDPAGVAAVVKMVVEQQQPLAQ